MTSSTQNWEIVFFTVNDVIYHLGLWHGDHGFADLSLLGSRLIDRDNPFFPKGEQSSFSIQIPNPHAMLEFIQEPNLLCSEIIEKERAQPGWHLKPEAPDFVLTLRDRRIRENDSMNCVEWILVALEKGGVQIPENILTTRQLIQWLKLREA